MLLFCWFPWVVIWPVGWVVWPLRTCVVGWIVCEVGWFPWLVIWFEVDGIWLLLQHGFTQEFGQHPGLWMRSFWIKKYLIGQLEQKHVVQFSAKGTRQVASWRFHFKTTKKYALLPNWGSRITYASMLQFTWSGLRAKVTQYCTYPERVKVL